MTERVTAIPASELLENVARLLAAGGFGGLPVVDDDNRVIGFVSETDVVGALLRGATADTRARTIMSHHPIVIDEFATADEVMGVLRESHIHHLPVVREGRLVGIITPHDVIRFFVSHVLPPPLQVG
jgi:CBS domain-containing protein